MNLNLSILERAYFGNSVLQWITSVLLILLFILLGRVCFWAIERRIKTVSSKTQSSFIELFVHSIKAPIIIIVIGFGIRLGLATLDFPNQFEIWIEHGFNLLVTIVLAWALINIYDQIHVHFLLPFARKTDANIDEQLLAIVRNVIRFSIWVLAIVIGLSNAGYDVGAIIAGLGIGGLAFALAGQNIISNFFGGILVLLERPFKLGDRILVTGIDGWVQEIGLRITTIENFVGQTIVIPNKTFTDNAVTNIDSRKVYYQDMVLHLHHTTTAEKVEFAMKILKEICRDSDLLGSGTWIGFHTINDYSFDIKFWYSIKLWCPEEKDRFPEYYSKIDAGKTYVNLEIMRRFADNGIKLAFPVQSIEINSSTNTHRGRSIYGGVHTDERQRPGSS